MKNVTIVLNETLLKKSRMLAVEQDMSLSQWIASLVFKEMAHRTHYQQTKANMLARMHTGLNLGGAPLTREEAHERQ